MNPKLMEKIWDSYAKLIPAGASETQRRETKRAFFAGARGLLRAMSATLDDGEEATDFDVSILASVYEELETFLEDVKAGRA